MGYISDSLAVQYSYKQATEAFLEPSLFGRSSDSYLFPNQKEKP